MKFGKQLRRFGAIAVLSLAHFVAFCTALFAEMGATNIDRVDVDMRSVRIGEAGVNVLGFPLFHLGLRIPETSVYYDMGLIVVILNSVLWGVALYAALSLVGRKRRKDTAS